MIEIGLLEERCYSTYENLLKISSLGMAYHSLQYKSILERVTGTEPLYLVAERDGEAVGALPAFLKRNGKYGNVLNSLPFFGSHGGILVRDDLDGRSILAVKGELLEAFDDLAHQTDCITATIIATPFERDHDFYKTNFQPTYIDGRIGQIVDLSRFSAEDELMPSFSSSCRRAVRKAMESDLEIRRGIRGEDMKELYDVYLDTIRRLNGIAKPISFFEELSKCQGEFSSIYSAVFRGEIVGGLLSFHYNGIVEYHTPFFRESYKHLRPMNLIVFEALKDALANRAHYYNFGGTWLSQDGVYRFKRNWGSEDFPYYYYTKCYRDVSDLKEAGPEALLEAYKWFYVLPFSELDGGMSDEDRPHGK
ncbi:MAG: lipid II:glycine glycyltransferase FemX [bacterium]